VSEATLIVGLGNPGSEYRQTRHNAGFMLVDRLAEDWRGQWRLEPYFFAQLSESTVAGRRVHLLKPQTYMNCSGESVAAAAGFFKVPHGRVLIVVDDADLPLGTVRLRGNGSSGGHHGLESVERHLGTRAYPRLRLGIARPAADRREISGHVLSRFTADERLVWEKVLDRAVGQVECWLESGLTAAMNKYNGSVI